MTQLAIRVDDTLIAELDHLVERKEFASRSEGIRVALKLLLEERRRAAQARQDVEAYTRVPEPDDDLSGLAEYATVTLTEDEPW